MHPELVGRLALIALMLRKHLKAVTLLELANSIRIRNAGTVHLRNETVKFALQICLTCQSRIMDCNFIVTSMLQLDPIGFIMLELFNPI